MSYSFRPVKTLADDLDGLHAHCANLADTSFGLSMIFAALAVLSLAGGLWLHEPMMASSAGFALAAATAFGLGGRELARTTARAPRVRVAVVKLQPDRRPA